MISAILLQSHKSSYNNQSDAPLPDQTIEHDPILFHLSVLQQIKKVSIA